MDIRVQLAKHGLLASIIIETSFTLTSAYLPLLMMLHNFRSFMSNSGWTGGDSGACSDSMEGCFGRVHMRYPK